jgi:glycine betaine/proline transport system ATP-binding protein
MKDGEIIQIGTPEELVIHPATDYVAEFTRDVQRAKVVSARRLMQATTGGEYGGTIKPDQRVSTFSSAIVKAGKPFAVVDASGGILGEVTPQAVIALLAGIEEGEAGHGASDV